ncbi:hypothetical protein F5Y17DRAFT_262709 [Xylariaceae sp. FL0594]|nr:hypothetical protein F5Y17DRAFT_262709 [Xylariaceae sp. FL0594]
MDPDVERILSFWFNRKPIEWIIAPEGLDTQLANEFSPIVEKARNNELDGWATRDARSSLALVVLLGQFSRNLHRGSPAFFSADAKASETAAGAIARGYDSDVSAIQASAFYLPLMQQKSLVSVIAARCLFEALRARCATDEEREWVDMGLAAAKRHLDQLLRFGRYPSRNSLLGRTSTQAEEEFLRDFKPTLK